MPDLTTTGSDTGRPPKHVHQAEGVPYFCSTFTTVQVGFSRFTFSSAAAWSGASTSMVMPAPLFVLMVKVKRMGEQVTRAAWLLGAPEPG
jgi:hypothetical protein